jgi:hypothetical protein
LISGVHEEEEDRLIFLGVNKEKTTLLLLSTLIELYTKDKHPEAPEEIKKLFIDKNK